MKKYFCLFLSSILLLSNTQIFCQEVNIASEIISPAEIEELSALAKEINSKYSKALRNITGTSDYIEHVNSGRSSIQNRNPYSLEVQVNGSYKVYSKEINELADRLNLFQSKMKETYARYIDALPEGTYLKKVTANYINDRMNTLFRTQNYYLDNLLSICDIISEHPEIRDISSVLKPVYFHSRESRQKYLEAQYKKESYIRNEFIKDLADNQTYYQKAFSEDMDKLIMQLRRAESSFSQEAIEFFSKKTHTADEILNYFASRLPENQKATLFALKISDEGLTIKQLIPYIRYYLKQTNRRLWKLEKFSAERLAVSLSKMPLTERVNFLDNLLDFTPEAKLLRNEIHQAEKVAGKRIINRGAIKLSGTFMVIGAFLVASTIVAVSADNSFVNSIGPAQLARIGRKIDNGQMISLQEMSAYYTDPRNTKKVTDDPLGLLEVFEIAITVNDCLDALNIEKENPVNTEIQQDQINNAVNESLDKIDFGKTDFGVGTL